MGSSNSKDKFIDLYISTNKQYYLPGDYVQGQAYLNVKDTRKYNNLCLRLQGVEHVHWTQGTRKKRRTYSNTYKSYSEHHTLVDFHGSVNAGQYLFPFAFLLPSMITGSYLQSQNCYIKYLLKLELVDLASDDKTQRFIMNLNILETPRAQFGPLSLTRSFNPKCCGCCSDYGITTVTLNCNRNFVYNGDNIHITGVINNSQGKQSIQKWGMALQQRRLMISSGGATRSFVDHRYPIQNNPPIVPAGTSYQINLNTMIPANIVDYTAIGRITARYFVIHLWTDYGCCTKNTASATLHLIVHSKTPMIVQKKQIAPPPNWSPKIYPKVSWNNLKPYQYNPLPKIPFLNMPTSQNVQQNNIMETTQNLMYEQNGSQMYGYQYYGYQMPSNDFVLPKLDYEYYNYNPVYYNQNMLSQAEQQYQGYNGVVQQMGQQAQGYQGQGYQGQMPMFTQQNEYNENNKMNS